MLVLRVLYCLCQYIKKYPGEVMNIKISFWILISLPQYFLRLFYVDKTFFYQLHKCRLMRKVDKTSLQNFKPYFLILTEKEVYYS